MSWNVDFSVGGGRRNVERIDERIIVTPGREIIEETITRGPYRERIEERVVVGPRREIIEERVIIDRPGDSYRRNDAHPSRARDYIYAIGEAALSYATHKPQKTSMHVTASVTPSRIVRPETTSYASSRTSDSRHDAPPPYSVRDHVQAIGKSVLPHATTNPYETSMHVTRTVTPGRIVRPETTSYASSRTSVYGWVPPSHCRGTITWVECHDGMVPSDGVHAGVDKDNSTIYAGRAWHEGDLLPAKVTPSHRCAYISWGGDEIRKDHYEVLCSRHVAWQFDSEGRVPVEAIACGHTSSGERLYMGRRMHDGTMTVGKIHPSHHCIYIPYGGREISYRDYEALVLS